MRLRVQVQAPMASSVVPGRRSRSPRRNDCRRRKRKSTRSSTSWRRTSRKSSSVIRSSPSSTIEQVREALLERQEVSHKNPVRGQRSREFQNGRQTARIFLRREMCVHFSFVKYGFAMSKPSYLLIAIDMCARITHRTYLEHVYLRQMHPFDLCSKNRSTLRDSKIT